MKLRVARHTTDLEKIRKFYSILGLNEMGSFKNHDGYNGIFLGKENLPWHLEFTTSNEMPDHHPDEDDLLVFYSEDKGEMDLLKQQFLDMGINELPPKNPYWVNNGHYFKDPDGFGIMLATE